MKFRVLICVIVLNQWLKSLKPDRTARQLEVSNGHLLILMLALLEALDASHSGWKFAKKPTLHINLYIALYDTRHM